MATPNGPTVVTVEIAYGNIVRRADFDDIYEANRWIVHTVDVLLAAHAMTIAMPMQIRRLS